MPCMVMCDSGARPFNEPDDAAWSRIGHNNAPWVQITFSDDENRITVSNISSPARGNKAIIKTFEYGSSGGTNGGMGMKVEIHDNNESELLEFIRNQNKKMRKISEDFRMKARFGWTRANCPDRLAEGGPLGTVSRDITFLPQNVTMNYVGGKIVFIFEGTDTLYYGLHTRTNDVFGDDSHPMSLTDAIRQLFKKDPEPIIEEVRFLKWVNGKEEKIIFEKGGEKGPECKWLAVNQTKIGAAQSWLNKWLSKEKRGVVQYTIDEKAGKPRLTFWDTYERGEKGAGEDPTTMQLRSYIVNGGNCSSVLNFNPRIHWNYTAGGLSGGATNAQESPATPNEKPHNKDSDKKEGNQTYATIDDDTYECYGKDKLGLSATQKLSKAVGTNWKIGLPFILPIEAELSVIGDTDRVFTTPSLWFQKFIGIIVINPFLLGGDDDKRNQNQGDSECPDWIAKPNCNTVLTHPCWQIKGINHSITPGSFITTFQLYLLVPGMHIEKPMCEFIKSPLTNEIKDKE